MQRRCAEEGLTKEAKIKLAKIEELLADGVSDVIVPWPRHGDLRVAENQKKATTVEGKTSSIFLKTLMDYEGNTHPSDAKFLENSERLTDKLASKRYDTYLENLYDSYVPEKYAVVEPKAVSFDNQEELYEPYALPEPEYQQQRTSFGMRMVGKLEEAIHNQVAQADEIFGDNKELLNKYFSTKLAMTIASVAPLAQVAHDAVQSAVTTRDVLTGAAFGLVTYVAGGVYQRHLQKQVAPEPHKAKI